MTKAEFKEKIAAQKEMLCQRHNIKSKVFKCTMIVAGVMGVLSIGGAIAGSITEIEPLTTICSTLIGCSGGAISGLWIGKQELDEAHENEMKNLDIILEESENLEQN